MKSKIFLLIAIIVLTVLVVYGKKYLDRITYDYNDEVLESLNNYYNSSDTKDLAPIIDLLNTYDADSDIVKGIQELCTKRVNSWVSYMDGKFICDYDNKEACVVQKSEYELLDVKIKSLYDFRGKETSIILPSSYKNISNKTKDKLVYLDKVIKSSRVRAAKTSEDIRLARCKSAVDCNCRNGMCACTYKENNKNYSISCKDKDYIPPENNNGY